MNQKNLELKNKKLRTIQQNKALHKYFELLAKSLNEAGLDMRVVLQESVAIDWTKENVKDYLWRPVQRAYIREHSTTKLTTKDIDKVFDFLHRHLTSKFGAFCEFPLFPSIEAIMLRNE